MTERLLTAADLAELLGAPESTVMEWCRTYRWPHVRLGRRFRWTPEQVEQIVAAHVVVGEKPDTSGRTARAMQRRRSA
ncbi:MAG: helix-turn-helix domain-containing protein [Nocardioides sp.]|uniref:helix-turn-helix domain-containing protein n=1 Tax=Nocardioides sp. TaxID=35761 RepID=UPI0039E5F1A6